VSGFEHVERVYAAPLDSPALLLPSAMKVRVRVRVGVWVRVRVGVRVRVRTARRCCYPAR
jgi:hypothetical protein